MGIVKFLFIGNSFIHLLSKAQIILQSVHYVAAVNVNGNWKFSVRIQNTLKSHFSITNLTEGSKQNRHESIRASLLQLLFHHFLHSVKSAKRNQDRLSHTETKSCPQKCHSHDFRSLAAFLFLYTFPVPV